jgi:hypothetical protein
MGLGICVLDIKYVVSVGVGRASSYDLRTS